MKNEDKIALINLQIDCEKEQLNYDRKVAEIDFKKREYIGKIKAAELEPKRLKLEGEDQVSKLELQAEQIKAKIDGYTEKIEKLEGDD